MTESRDRVVNRLAAPTWRWLKLNETQIRLPDHPGAAAAHNPTADAKTWQLFAGLPAGMGEDWSAYVGTAFPQEACRGLDATETVRVSLVASGDGAVCGAFLLDVPEGRSCRLVMDYSSGPDATGQMLVDLRIRLGRGARAHLIQNSRLGGGVTLCNSVGILCEAEAEMDSVQMWVGGRDTLAGYRCVLQGAASACAPKVGYRVGGGCRQDYNYEMIHEGQNTACDVLFSGILEEDSSKIFRGTIDFRRGSAGAVGTENEEVLLLGERCSNGTIPLILCAEEDVKGNHGATLGQLGEEERFYLASRGLDAEEITSLLIRARLQRIAGQMEDEKAREEILAWIGEHYAKRR